MRAVFIDTVAWIALINTSDELHLRARQLMDTFRQQNVFLVTTEYVLLEVADALSTPSLRQQTIAFVNGLRQLSILHIVPASSSLFAEGWALYSERPDKEWGLTDCTSFVVMKHRQASHAFTSDRHFEQAGFVTVL